MSLGRIRNTSNMMKKRPPTTVGPGVRKDVCILTMAPVGSSPVSSFPLLQQILRQTSATNDRQSESRTLYGSKDKVLCRFVGRHAYPLPITRVGKAA